MALQFCNRDGERVALPTNLTSDLTCEDPNTSPNLSKIAFETEPGVGFCKCSPCDGNFRPCCGFGGVGFEGNATCKGDLYPKVRTYLIHHDCLCLPLEKNCLNRKGHLYSGLEAHSFDELWCTDPNEKPSITPQRTCECTSCSQSGDRCCNANGRKTGECRNGLYRTDTNLFSPNCICKHRDDECIDADGFMIPTIGRNRFTSVKGKFCPEANKKPSLTQYDYGYKRCACTSCQRDEFCCNFAGDAKEATCADGLLPVVQENECRCRDLGPNACIDDYGVPVFKIRWSPTDAFNVSCLTNDLWPTIDEKESYDKCTCTSCDKPGDPCCEHRVKNDAVGYCRNGLLPALEYGSICECVAVEEKQLCIDNQGNPVTKPINGKDVGKMNCKTDGFFPSLGNKDLSYGICTCTACDSVGDTCCSHSYGKDSSIEPFCKKGLLPKIDDDADNTCSCRLDDSRQCRDKDGSPVTTVDNSDILQIQCNKVGYFPTKDKNICECTACSAANDLCCNFVENLGVEFCKSGVEPFVSGNECLCQEPSSPIIGSVVGGVVGVIVLSMGAFTLYLRKKKNASIVSSESELTPKKDLEG